MVRTLPSLSGKSQTTGFVKLVNIMETLWYFIIFGSASVYSRDIYNSINWDPRNPMWVFWFLCRCVRFWKGYLRIFTTNLKLNGCSKYTRKEKVFCDSACFLGGQNQPVVFHCPEHEVTWIDPFRITFGLFFKASPGAHPFIWKLVVIHMQMKTSFYMKRWAPGLALKKRPKVIRKWPIRLF